MSNYYELQKKYEAENIKVINVKYKKELVSIFEKALCNVGSNKSQYFKEQMIGLINDSNLIDKDLYKILKFDFTCQAENLETPESKAFYKKLAKEKEMQLAYFNSLSKSKMHDILNEWLIYSSSPTTTYRLKDILSKFERYSKNENVKLLRYIKHSSTPKTTLY